MQIAHSAGESDGAGLFGRVRHVTIGIAIGLLAALSTSARAEPRPEAEPAAPISQAALPPALPTTAPSNPDVDRLTTQLLSANWRLREQAQDRLAELADAAEPALQRVMATSGSSEARTRAQVALLQMAAVKRLGPTLVTLHLTASTPQQAFAALAGEGHVAIVAAGDSLWRQSERRSITIDLVDVPFWSAARKLCVECGYRAMYAGGDDEAGRIVLTRDAVGEMTSPAALSSSFMVLATSVARKMSFGSDADAAPRTGDVDLQFTFYADPKWRILEHPELTRIDRVADDRGRPIEDPDAMRMQMVVPESPIWLMKSEAKRVPLDARTLRMRGSFRIVLLEQSEPAEFTDVLNARNVVRKISGRTVQLRDAVREGEGYKVRVTLFRNGLSAQEWRQQREQQGIQLFDDKGHPLARSGGAGQELGDQVDYDLTYYKSDDSRSTSTPSRLVVQIPLEQKELTVPFEFKDLPIEK